MIFVIALHFLAGVVLTAPQQQSVRGGIKPFKEVPTDFTHCWIKNVAIMLPPTSIPSEECTGTMTYRFRRLYKMPENRENYTSIDECLRSRNINPDALDSQRILNEDNYRDGVFALRSAYNALSSTDPEGVDVLSEANKGLDTAQEKLKTALSPELFEKIDTNIKVAKGKLSVPGVNMEAVVDNLKKLRDWIRNTTTEKYTISVQYSWHELPYN
ncbi:hypothetical protein MGU_10518 [Metarhizium guizhouense ARSEF 977]|uniref:Uncharacterized protein n=1 Tax=Metarhizium guizhouense (strain ARSEF 977) TaxID=1276136 RepID=A0A0B4GQY7_METGA|nr:hypothetical protein MGU_10518 [Metarhizium guizhouense ARSEF 977]